MTWREAYLEFGRRYWSELAIRCKSNVSAMARSAGIRRQNVYPNLHRFGVTIAEQHNPFAHRGNWGD